jgi:glycosyltransferase involved in cell wall biosynthesis
MRIALCLEYPLAYQGGVSVLCQALAAGLSARHEVVLVSPDTADAFATLQKTTPFHSHVPWNPATVSKTQSRALAAALQQRGVQLAHFHFGGNFGWGSRFPGQSPIPCLARGGVAVLTTVHLVVGPLDGYCGPQKPLWFKLALWPVAWLGKMNVLRHLRMEIVVSQFGARCLRRWYWPFRQRIQTIYHSRFSAKVLPMTSVPRERFILYAGHIAERKGQHILAEAFVRVASRYPDWKLVLLGDGEEELQRCIRRLAAEHSLEERIEMPGARPDAPAWMRRAEVFVQPSFFEGLPLALQEALHCGCTCLATDIPGNNELITDGENGLLVPKGDPAAMASGLERLLADEKLRELFRSRGPASVLGKGMSLEQMIQRHLELYESLI